MQAFAIATEQIGNYRIVRKLATGGTSDVLLATMAGPHGFERSVVLKLLLAKYSRDERFVRMFAREAGAYARLAHPAIVHLHDFLSVDGRLVMVLEHVHGAPLSRVRAMLKTVGHDVDDIAALHIGAQIFEALAAAHAATDKTGGRAPLIHRDVNPSNVLIGWNGEVKLGDFGLAKATSTEHESVAGLANGTYGYTPPEQVTGRAVSPRTDVYAGAVILWELLTRTRAFPRLTCQYDMWRTMAEPRIESLDVLRPDLDPAVRDLVHRALAPAPEDRNVTAQEIVAVLRERVGAESGQHHLESLMTRIRHEPRSTASDPPPAMLGPAARAGGAAPLGPARGSLPTLDMSEDETTGATAPLPEASDPPSGIRVVAAKPAQAWSAGAPRETDDGSDGEAERQSARDAQTEALSYIITPLPFLAEPSTDRDADIDVPTPLPRRRSRWKTFVLFLLVALVAVIVADRLGCLRLPYRDAADAKIRGWVHGIQKRA